MKNTEQPPQELIAWLDEIREKGIVAPADAPKSYTVRGYRVDGTHKDFRAMDAYQAERDAEMLWNTGNWTRIEINGVERYAA